MKKLPNETKCYEMQARNVPVLHQNAPMINGENSRGKMTDSACYKRNFVTRQATGVYLKPGQPFVKKNEKQKKEKHKIYRGWGRK